MQAERKPTTTREDINRGRASTIGNPFPDRADVGRVRGQWVATGSGGAASMVRDHWTPVGLPLGRRARLI
jgi:hypothetical protein